MLKRFLRVISDVLWILGEEDLAMTFLLKTYDAEEFNQPKRSRPQTEIGFPEDGYKIKIVFEDKDLSRRLEPAVLNAICLPTCVEDIN